MDTDNRLFIEEDLQLLTGAAVAMLIAGLGGVVNWLRKARKKNWGSFAAAIVTAAFSGLLSHLLTSWLNMDIHLQYAISGAAGYSGGMLLDAVTPALLHIVHHRTKALHETDNNEKDKKDNGGE